jgi:hypothetical protein
LRRKITSNTPNIIFEQCARIKLKEASQQWAASTG